MLNATQYKASSQAARGLIAEMKVTQAPVPVFEIINKKGIVLTEYNLGPETSGVLFIDNGKATIGYNPKDPQVRKRFTVAHELGHYLLHRNSNHLFVDSYFLVKFRGNNSYSPEEYLQEQQANAFAAELLMPEEFVKGALQSDKFIGLSESEMIAKLASTFEVSVAAMSFRLTNMNIF